MAIGIIASAQMSAAAGGAPEWLPEGAIAFADFQTADHYYAGGETIAFADAFPTAAKDVDGLVIVSASGSKPLAGAFLAALALPFTIVAKLTKSTTSAANVMDLQTADPTAYAAVATNDVFMTTDDGDAAVLDTFGSFEDSTSQRVAGTLSAGKAARSTNGEVVVVDTNQTLVMPPFTEASLRASYSGHIQQIVIYPAKADADLPALSALA